MRVSITTFNGYTGTKPEKELENVKWEDVCKLMCPPEPATLSEKKLGQYVVPCLLKEAPLVAKTLEAAKSSGTSTTGKMRSKNHVTEASMAIIDIDGLTEADFMACREKMKSDGVSFQVYTTHSHGSQEKPGVRARLIMPIDRHVTTEEYFAAWHGIDKHYLNGQASIADASGAHMYQQQGTWCCHPDRIDQAKFWSNSAGVASANALIEMGRIIQADQSGKAAPKSIGANNKNITSNRTYPPSDARKIADACQQIRTFRDAKGAGQSEPLWNDCLGIVGHCQNGSEICQEWSSGYSGHSEVETAKKIAKRLNTAPTTCSQFQRTNPEGCNDCTHKCHSPITLGSEKQDALAAIQQQFALLKMDGKIFVLETCNLEERTKEGLAKKLVISNLNDGKFLVVRALKAQFPQENAENISKAFTFSPNTICYDDIEFNPRGNSGKKLNLWVGPTINPISGQWPRIKEFLLEVICSADQDAYHYLIKYIAHALQRPWEKPGVMIILIAGQGTGKGTLGRIIQRIWSATFLQVNNIDAVTGDFNASLERAFFVFMDEALFSGNRRGSDALKSIVTEPILHINEKYQPSRQIRSYHRFIAATNADHFKHTERDDRRDFTLRLSEVRKGDLGYWKLLNDEIINGGVEAMVFDLLATDLSDFNVRNKPNTKELVEQKIHSLEPIERWWHDSLYNGAFSNSDTWPEFIGSLEAIECIDKFNGGKMFKKPSATTISQALQKLCPSATYRQMKPKTINRQAGSYQHERKRGYLLPTLQQARIEFEQNLGGVIKWPEADCVEEPAEHGSLEDDSDLCASPF